MQLSVFEDNLREACPPGKQLVFAVLVAGFPTTLTVRYMGHTGRSVIAKFMDSYENPVFLRNLMNVSVQVKTVKVAFVFLGFANVGFVPEFRKSWYRKYGKVATSRFGSMYTAKELVICVPNRSLQFQLELNIDNMEVLDFKSFPKLEAAWDRPADLRRLAEHANLMNL